MSTQNTIAGLLTAFGVIGLAIAPFQPPSEELWAKANQDKVALAISLGGQLRLDQEDAQRTFETSTSATTHNMVCSDVYRLRLADIGLSCRTITGTKAVAFAN